MSPSTTSDQIGKGEKRSASEGSSQDGSKQKVRKVVVGQNHDNSTNREDGEGLKQQKLVVEPPTTTTKEEEGTEKKKEEQEVIVIDDEDEGKSNDKGNGTNGDHDDKKDSTGDEDNKKKDDGEVLATREEGEKDQGKNFEPGEKPDLNLSKQDFERKHGILETGHVYFLYRPKVEINEPHSLSDVSKFNLLLVPHHSKLHRLLRIGKKVLPDHSKSSRAMWGEIVSVGQDMKSLKESLGGYSYETQTLGTRNQPGSRVAASGVYVLHSTENPPKGSENAQAVWETKFAYQVALPHEMGEVQDALNIHPEGVFSLQVKNPESPSNNPAAPTQDPSRHPQFPDSLQSLFKTKFIPADPPVLLDYPGAELLLIPSNHKVKEDIGDEAQEKLEQEEKELEGEISNGGGEEIKKALKEMGLEGLIEGKALEGHWE